MASAGSVTIDFAAETAKFTAEMKKVRGELKTLQSQVGGISGALGKAGSALKTFAGGFAIAGTIRAVVQATAESEAAVSKLESALKSAGGNVAQQSAKFQAFATQLQGVTTYTDEAVLGVQSLLLSFQGLSGDTVLRASSAVLDVSSRLGVDLRAASISVGKALQDPVAGLSALSRAGVQFTSTQRAAIQAMVESGNKAGAQALILQELEKRFGGAAEAARNNFSGALTAVQNSLGDLLETKGGLPAATGSLNELARILQDPGIKAGADALFSTLIRGAAAAAEFIGQTAAGLAILAGKGTNEIVNLDLRIDALEAKRKRILQSVGGRVELLGPGFRKELDDANRQIDELLRKQRQLLEVGEFSGSALLRPQTVTAGRISEPTEEERLARLNAEIAQEKALLDVGLKSIEAMQNESNRILDAIAEESKPRREARLEALRQESEAGLAILTAEIDRKLALDIQYADAKVEEEKRILDAQKARSAEEIKLRQETAFKSIAILGFLVQGGKNANKALDLINKASAIRNAIMDAHAGAAKAMKIYGPTPVGFAAAAASIAFGALQVKGILSADTSLSIGGGASAPAATSTSADFAPEVTVERAEPQRAVQIYINGYISRDVVDDLMTELDDRFRGGAVVIRGGTNQANEIRRSA